MKQGQQATVIAIDLGSNSFHLLEAGLDAGGRLRSLTALARKVQLALDMGPEGLTAAARERGLACLQEFAPYCRDLPPDRVRVVGTQALRAAANRDSFVCAAEALLGHPVAVVSGEEEARLAYLGVSADPATPPRPLVADIGGGSTELVAGEGERIDSLASLAIGCVSWLRYFPDGEISAGHFDAAQAAARRVFASQAQRFRGDWQATGCSGTLLAVADVLRQGGWSDGEINASGLQHLRRALLQFDHIDRVRFQGLQENRRNIFASGVAIVSAMFEALSLQTMAVSNYGLREGVAWQLLKPLREAAG